jgi:CheY-like chemotaxis protein
VRRIVVVEDHVDSAELLAELLRIHGHDVVVAHDASSGLRLIQDTHPDVALLDIELPGMDGYQLAARLRSSQNPPMLVALTGYGQDADRRRALAAGFDHHMVKPVDVTRLLVLMS